MKISRILAIFGAFCIGGIASANAAYPVYTGYVPGSNTVQYGTPIVAPQPVAQTQPLVLQQPVTAAQPTRVTGTLPNVGSNAAGRQYYDPASYDRLSDSGLYVGLSVAYAGSVQGGIGADYGNEQDAWFAPGDFKKTNYKTGTVIPLQLSVGASLNSDVRVDFSYTRISNISHADSAQTSDGAGGFIGVDATGGAITSTATMLNLYYNLDSFTGSLAGGALRPYVGVGVGIGTNTISDFVIHDPNYYAQVATGAPSPAGAITGVSDIYGYHAGGTTENFTYMLEGGVTTEMSGGIKIDFFVRYMGLGKVQTSGSIVMSQTEWVGTGVGVMGDDTAEQPSGMDSVYHYTNWYESGNIGLVDIGVRLRLQF